MMKRVCGLVLLLLSSLDAFAHSDGPAPAISGTRCDLQLVTGSSGFSNSAFAAAEDHLETLGYTLRYAEKDQARWGLTEFQLHIYAESIGSLLSNVQAYFDRALDADGRRTQVHTPFTNGETSLEGNGPKNRLFSMAIGLVPECRIVKASHSK